MDSKQNAEGTEFMRGDETSIAAAPALALKNKRKFITKFQQQQLEGWLFFPTLKCVLIFGILIGSLMIIMGTVFLTVTSDVKELEYNYDSSCDNLRVCNTTVDISDDIQGPIYFYYGISPYYQNYRDYVKSLSYKQLAGKTGISSDTLDKECKPIKYIQDLKKNVYSVAGFYISDDKIANPCGLVAKSYFNDSYSLVDQNNNFINLKTTEISHKIDRERVFKRTPTYYRDQYIDVEDEHFINWIRFASTSWWYKLWARIELDKMLKGKYTITIYNNYNVSKFSGVKSIMISNSSSLGGRSRFLGGFFILTGCIYLLMCIVLYFKRKRNDDDEAIDWSAFD